MGLRRSSSVVPPFCRPRSSHNAFMLSRQVTALLARNQSGSRLGFFAQFTHGSQAVPHRFFLHVWLSRGYRLTTCNQPHGKQPSLHVSFAFLPPIFKRFYIWHDFWYWFILCPVLPIILRFSPVLFIYLSLYLNKSLFLWLLLSTPP